MPNKPHETPLRSVLEMSTLPSANQAIANFIKIQGFESVLALQLGISQGLLTVTSYDKTCIENTFPEMMRRLPSILRVKQKEREGFDAKSHGAFA